MILIEPITHGDSRGYFVETFRQDLIDDALGYKVNFIQDNESKSEQGVFRGLHYQLPPFAQTKLVRAIEGRVLDIAVDIRRSSKTFGKYVSAELTGQNKHQLLVPKGFAHGFLVLSEVATFAYKVDNFYSPAHDRGIAFDCSQLKIDCQLPHLEIQLSERDKSNSTLETVKDLFK